MQNTISEQLSALESAEYNSSINVHSSISAGFDAIKRSDPVIKLTMLCRNSPKALDAVLERMGKYLDQPEDSYESPYDCSIAALLFVLLSIDPALASFASMGVLRTNRFWWARALANSYLLDKEIRYDKLRQPA